MRRLLYVVLLFFAWLLLITAMGADPRPLLSLGPLQLLTLFLLYLAPLLLGVLSFHLAFRFSGAPVSFRTSFLATLFSFFVDSVTPTVMPAGEASSAIVLKKLEGVPYQRGLKGAALQVIGWNFGSSLFFGAAGIYALSFSPFLAFPLLLFSFLLFSSSLGFVLFLRKKSLVKRVYSVVQRLRKKVISEEDYEKFEREYMRFKEVKPGQVMAVGLLAILSHLLLVLNILYISSLFFPTTLFQAFLAYAVSSSLGLMLLVPSGVGVFDYSLSTLLGSPQVPLVYRTFHLWISLLGGLAVALHLGIRE